MLGFFLKKFMIFFFIFSVSNNWLKKRSRSYDTELNARAYADVNERNMSVYRAAREYGVPESPLRDRHLQFTKPWNSFIAFT